MRTVRAAAVLFGLAAPVAFIVACGARTGLLYYGELDAAVAEDSGSDVPILDELPGLDVQPLDVVIQLACRDASDTLIYAVTGENTLLRFDPSSATFTQIGILSCPDPFDRGPFSMAVDRQGNAYVLYANYNGVAPSGEIEPGNIFKVNLNTADCEPTSYVPNAQFLSFGMAFSADPDAGTGETLYIASDNDNSPTGFLGAIDETTLVLSYVGTFSPTVSSAELTGTGDGRLYGFWAPNGGPNDPGSAIVQINPTNAVVFGQASLPSVTQGTGWAFGFWGGNFYLFTAPDDATSIVQRYNPVDGSIVQVATYPEIIVGAGVSTCAPVQ